MRNKKLAWLSGLLFSDSGVHKNTLALLAGSTSSRQDNQSIHSLN